MIPKGEPDSVMRRWPEQDRPTVKLFQMGASSLTDSELVAVLLRTGHKDQSAVEVARALIAQAGSLSALVRDTEANQLTMKPDQRARLQATLELARRCLRENLAQGSALSSPQVVRDYLRLKLEGLPHEVFVGVFCDAQNT